MRVENAKVGAGGTNNPGGVLILLMRGRGVLLIRGGRGTINPGVDPEFGVRN